MRKYKIIVKDEMFVMDEYGNEIELKVGEIYQIEQLSEHSEQEVIIIDGVDYDIALEPKYEGELYDIVE
jgi:hypothetical protein